MFERCRFRAGRAVDYSLPLSGHKISAWSVGITSAGAVRNGSAVTCGTAAHVAAESARASRNSFPLGGNAMHKHEDIPIDRLMRDPQQPRTLFEPGELDCAEPEHQDVRPASSRNRFPPRGEACLDRRRETRPCDKACWAFNRLGDRVARTSIGSRPPNAAIQPRFSQIAPHHDGTEQSGGWNHEGNGLHGN